MWNLVHFELAKNCLHIFVFMESHIRWTPTKWTHRVSRKITQVHFDAKYDALTEAQVAKRKSAMRTAHVSNVGSRKLKMVRKHGRILKRSFRCVSKLVFSCQRFRSRSQYAMLHGCNPSLQNQLSLKSSRFKSCRAAFAFCIWILKAVKRVLRCGTLIEAVLLWHFLRVHGASHKKQTMIQKAMYTVCPASGSSNDCSTAHH